MNNWKKLAFTIGALASVVAAGALATTVKTGHAAGKSGTVTYNANDARLATGDLLDANMMVPLYVDGETAFSIEPGVPIKYETTSGYVGNPTTLPRRAMLAMNLWQKAYGTSFDARMFTQLVVWQNLDGENQKDYTSLEGYSDKQIEDQKKKLNDLITQYDLVPSFHEQSYKLRLGETMEIKNTVKDVNLAEFDKRVDEKNGLDVQVKGDSIFVTPTKADVNNATVSYKKSYNEGTPYVWKKRGQQTLANGGIENPNSFAINFEIDTTTSAKIVKVDASTGDPVPNTEFKVTYESLKGKVTDMLTTDKNGEIVIRNVAHNSLVTAEEVNVPAPYVLNSALGGNNIVKGTASVDELLVLTQRNDVATGKIAVTKTGAASNTDMWNENYSLYGNEFTVTNSDGDVVETIRTNAKGFAETSDQLPLGTYVVTETKASSGFVQTFEPVTVELTRKDQHTAIAIGDAVGTNQEITGQATILKQDGETKRKSQGRARLQGAQYTLYHADGNPVQWDEAFAPTLTKGTKVDDVNVTVQIDDALGASVEHLAIGEYYWQESKAPEGYQIDATKHHVVVANTVVVPKIGPNVSSERVIKLVIDGYKMMESSSTNATTGENGSQLNLTPIDATLGEGVKEVTRRDASGNDGYWRFEVPYGDYELTEENTPEGFELITPLVINSKYDSAKDEYTFTITEKGQTAPIKSFTISAADINSGTNVISLARLILVGQSIEVEEPPYVDTVLVTKKDELKEFDARQSTTIVDKVILTTPKQRVGTDVYVHTQFHKIFLAEDGNVIKGDNGVIKSEVIGDVKGKQRVRGLSTSFNVAFDVKANTLKANERLVATQVVYEDAEYSKEYARHDDLLNQDQTIAPEAEPTMTAKFVAVDGVSQVIDSRIDNKLVDKVDVTVADSRIGSSIYVDTEFHKVSVDANGEFVVNAEGAVVSEVVEKISTKHELSATVTKFDVPFTLKAKTLKENERLVATHVGYTDSGKFDEYVRHFDLRNKQQTVTPEKIPTMDTLFVVVDTDIEDDSEGEAADSDDEDPAKQAFDISKDALLVDYVDVSIDESRIGTSLYLETKFHKVFVDKDGALIKDENGEIKNEIVSEIESTFPITATESRLEVPFNLGAKTLKVDERLVATHIAYTDEARTNEYIRHDDLTNNKQTVRPEVKPTIETLFVVSADKATTDDAKLELTAGETQIFDSRFEQQLVDKARITVDPSRIGSTVYVVTEFHKLSGDVNEVIGQVETEYVLSEETSVYNIPFTLKANALAPNDKLVATHIVYSDKAKAHEFARHYDLKNDKQTIIAEETPTMDSLFVTKDGKSVVKYSKENELVSKVTLTVPKSKVNRKLYVHTEFHKVTVNEDGTLVKDDEGNIVHQVIGDVTSVESPEKATHAFDVPFVLKADTLEDNERLVATHVVFTDEKHENEYVRHFDLENSKQTISGKKSSTIPWTPIEPSIPVEPETSEPETSEPETSEPETSEPETSEPETSKPETSEPETSEPETSEPETSEPETSEPETSDSTGGTSDSTGGTSDSKESKPKNKPKDKLDEILPVTGNDFANLMNIGLIALSGALVMVVGRYIYIRKQHDKE